MRDVIVGTLSKKPAYCQDFLRSLSVCHPYFSKKDIYVIDDTRLTEKELKQLDWCNGITMIPSIRPWGFSKNANFLVQAALIRETDLLLCNDDTEFITPNGIYALQQITLNYPNLGLLSPIFVGAVGNARQIAFKGQYKEGEVLVIENDGPLCFVAIYIPYNTLTKVGFLNEVFSEESYGWEDNEYCDRVREAGLDLGITPMVKMRHGKPNSPLSSTYRELVNFDVMVEKGKMLYKQETQRRRLLNAKQLKVR